MHRNIQKYAEFCINLQESAEIWRNMQEYTGKNRNIQEVCRNIEECTGIPRNYIGIYRNRLQKLSDRTFVFRIPSVFQANRYARRASWRPDTAVN